MLGGIKPVAVRGAQLVVINYGLTAYTWPKDFHDTSVEVLLADVWQETYAEQHHVKDPVTNVLLTDEQGRAMDTVRDSRCTAP
jgi:hypothetical protein